VRFEPQPRRGCANRPRRRSPGACTHASPRKLAEAWGPWLLKAVGAAGSPTSRRLVAVGAHEEPSHRADFIVGAQDPDVPISEERNHGRLSLVQFEVRGEGVTE
jgi:hypothetical protein